jgi:hypothetical protein
MAQDYPTAANSFDVMIACGDRLIEAQRLEASLSDVYAESQQGFTEWQESRRWVESLAAEYAAAVGQWREAMERETSQIPTDMRKNGGREGRRRRLRVA